MVFNGFHVGKYTSSMDPMGFFSQNGFLTAVISRHPSSSFVWGKRGSRVHPMAQEEFQQYYTKLEQVELLSRLETPVVSAIP